MEEPVFYTAVDKEVLQVVGEEVGNADGLHFSCQMGVLRGTPDLPVLFKVALFGTEPLRPEWAAKYLAQSSVKMASATCSRSSGSKAAMAMVWGKTVVVPVRATSWETSFHQ